MLPNKEQELEMVRFRPDMVATVPFIDGLCGPLGVVPDTQLEPTARSALFGGQPTTMRIAQGVHRRP